MRRDLDLWCRACVKCATRSVGRAVRPRLTPVPVGGPFDMVGVDVLQLPRTKRGNRYAVVFMDYLTKWPEVYATADQTAPTIARLLVEGPSRSSCQATVRQRTFLPLSSAPQCM